MCNDVQISVHEDDEKILLLAVDKGDPHWASIWAKTITKPFPWVDVKIDKRATAGVTVWTKTTTKTFPEKTWNKTSATAGVTVWIIIITKPFHWENLEYDKHATAGVTVFA